MSWICRYCGKDTKWIDMDYLVGTDHLQCALENNNKVKTKLKIENPHHINTKNYQMDGSIVEISYMGYEARTNASDGRLYFVYKFEGHKNTFRRGNVIFEVHTDITNNKVQHNIWRGGGMEFNTLSVDVIRDKDELLKEFIKEVNEY
jgi:hypothetical protein